MIEDDYRDGPTVVVCDADGCDNVLHYDGHVSNDRAAELAEAEDWRVDAVGDTYCPEHADLA